VTEIESRSVGMKVMAKATALTSASSGLSTASSSSLPCGRTRPPGRKGLLQLGQEDVPVDPKAPLNSGRASDPLVTQKPRLHPLREQHVAEERHRDVRPVERRQRGESEVAAERRER
jgi:hypothetical protein